MTPASIARSRCARQGPAAVGSSRCVRAGRSSRGSGSGFCNDMTMDAEGNLYATDSWYPRILRLPAGGDALEQWAVDPIATRSLSAFWNVAGTADTPALLQAEGTCYATPSYWHGRPVIRFSFCNASTTQLDA